MRVAGEKRPASVVTLADGQPVKRKRGRPPGSKTMKGKHAAQTPGPSGASPAHSAAEGP